MVIYYAVIYRDKINSLVIRGNMWCIGNIFFATSLINARKITVYYPLKRWKTPIPRHFTNDFG